MKVNGNIISLLIYDRLRHARENNMDLGETWDVVMSIPELQDALRRLEPNPFHQVSNASGRDACWKCGRARDICAC